MLPTELFASYSLETVDTVQGVFIPLASISGLTAAEANETTGDGREVWRALCMTAYEAITSDPTPPAKLTASKSEGITGPTRRRLDLTFGFDVIVPIASYQMEPEPVA